jgi:hypothetical protein
VGRAEAAARPAEEARRDSRGRAAAGAAVRTPGDTKAVVVALGMSSRRVTFPTFAVDVPAEACNVVVDADGWSALALALNLELSPGRAVIGKFPKVEGRVEEQRKVKRDAREQTPNRRVGDARSLDLHIAPPDNLLSA